MPKDWSKTLVVGVSSTALFDLSEQDRMFREATKADREAAIDNYRREMRELEESLLAPGSAMPVVKALLGLNKHTPSGEEPLVEVVVMSRNSPETGVRVLNSIRDLGLGITRSAFRGGQAVAPILRSYNVDLFLTTSGEDAQQAIDDGSCAAAVIRPPSVWSLPEDDLVRIAFDGDAVLFSAESELRYKNEGIAAFHQHESINTDVPMEDGPYANLLRKLGKMQERLPTRVEYSPVRVAIVTARNAPSDLRVIKTLRSWNVYVDEAYFLGGLQKGPVLEALAPHIFFDDQEQHIASAEKVVPSGMVPHKSLSPLSGGGRAGEPLPTRQVDTHSGDGDN